MAKKSRTIRVDPEVKKIIDRRRELMRANGLKATRSDAIASLLRGDQYFDSAAVADVHNSESSVEPVQ